MAVILWLTPTWAPAQSQPADNIDQYITEVLINSGYGGALAEEVVRRQRLLESALRAKPAAENARPSNPQLTTHSNAWSFQNATERARKILELRIRLAQLTKNRRVWKPVEVKPLQTVADMDCGQLLNTSAAKFFPRLVQRVSPQSVIVQVFPVNAKGEMVSQLLLVDNFSEESESEFELTRLSGFYVVLLTEVDLQTEAGIENIYRGRYVNAKAVQSVLDFAEHERPTTVEKWTSADRLFSVNASVADVQADAIVLQKEDDTRITVPMAKLSPECMERARAYLDARQPLSGP